MSGHEELIEAVDDSMGNLVTLAHAVQHLCRFGDDDCHHKIYQTLDIKELANVMEQMYQLTDPE